MNQETSEVIDVGIKVAGNIIQELDKLTTTLTSTKEVVIQPPVADGRTVIDVHHELVYFDAKNLEQALNEAKRVVNCPNPDDVGCTIVADPQWKITHDGRRRVRSTTVHITITVRVPTWRNVTLIRGQFQEVIDEWRRFENDIRVHEDGHVAHSTDTYRDIHLRLLGKRPNQIKGIFEAARIDNRTARTAYHNRVGAVGTLNIGIVCPVSS